MSIKPRAIALGLGCDRGTPLPTLAQALAEALAALPEVTRHFDRATIDRLTDPANYLGLAPQMVDRALALSATVGA